MFVTLSEPLSLEDCEVWADLLRADPCSYCGKARGGTVDHVDARMRGGGDEPENLTDACGRCNSSKQATPLLLWLVRRATAPLRIVHVGATIGHRDAIDAVAACLIAEGARPLAAVERASELLDPIFAEPDVLRGRILRLPE